VSLVACIVIAAGWRQSPRRAGDALAAGILAGAWLVPPLYEWNSALLLVPLAQWLQAVGRRAPGIDRRLDRMQNAKCKMQNGGAGASRSRFGVRAATALLCAAGMATLALDLRWPYGSRLVWPTIVL